MPAEIEFLLLGSFMVRQGGITVPIRRGNQRVVLAALLLAPNRIVSMEDLAHLLWEFNQPPSAHVTMRNYVKRLRHALGDVGRELISTEPRGYSVRVRPDELDVSRFGALLTTARAAARDGSWHDAAARARAALALWRGEPLADVESEALRSREVHKLAEMRLQAAETRIEAELHLGGHAEVITECRELATANPLREHLHALLMLALYHSGRQAEALAAYQQARRALIDELGTEPSTELRELHARILAADRTLPLSEQAPAVKLSPTSTWPTQVPGTPRQLPGTVRHFVGRDSELAELDKLVTQDHGHPGTMVISAINGVAGVGKTALALHWAHRAADRFPDGQLYVDMRGYDPGPPMLPTNALAIFLRALGVPGHAIPGDEDERAARYRSLLAGRRMLVLLDNARSAGQVRPLLPGTSTCVTIVTSRDPLTGLSARHGAQRLDLDALPMDDAVSLLRALVGTRVEAEPDAAAKLAGQCCRIPLALRVSAEFAAGCPSASLTELVSDLAGSRPLLPRSRCQASDG